MGTRVPGGDPEPLGGTHCFGETQFPWGELPWESRAPQGSVGSHRSSEGAAGPAGAWRRDVTLGLPRQGSGHTPAPPAPTLVTPFPLSGGAKKPFAEAPRRKAQRNKKVAVPVLSCFPCPPRSHAALPSLDSGEMLPGLSRLLTREVLIACVALRTRETTPATETYLI